MTQVVLIVWLTLMLFFVPVDQLRVTLSATVIMAGGTLTLSCHVPRDPANRVLEYGVSEYSPGSQRTLDGEHAPITWSATFKHIPCGVDTGYCAVLTQSGQWTQAAQHFMVGGCD